MPLSSAYAELYEPKGNLMDIPPVHHFDGRGISEKIRDVALIAALGSLNIGETIRYRNIADPSSLIRKLMIEFGSKIEWEYIDRRPKSIIIEFTRVEYPGSQYT